ncbi:MAG TPA: glycogen debranching N-terminal domain-containing protein [Gaiellales bacterium]
MLTILDGNRFLVCDDLGDVAGGVDGLYSDDTRHLSRWVMLLDGKRPKLLSSGLRDHASAVVYAQHDVGSPSQPSPLAAVRELFVSAGSLQERLVLENHGPGEVSVVVRYEFDCDFLDLFEVKSQSFGERDLAFAKTITPLRTARRYDPGARAFVFDADGGGFAAECSIQFSESGVPGDRACDFEVTLPARCAWTLDVAVMPRTPGDGPPERGEAFLLRERTRVRDSQRRFADALPTLESNAPGLASLYRQSLVDLNALRMRSRRGAPDSDLVAAGLPWFMAPFGRDTLISSFQALPLGDGLARAALHALGDLQARRDSPAHDAEPGKILHEMRYGKVATLTGQFPYYGSVDSTLLYLILLSETWRWSGDDELARQLEPVARGALEWLEQHADLDGDGFVEFHRRSERGLEVQCWKDSWDSMQFADGTLAQSPLAVSEVQGYAYAARVRCAELAREVWGDVALAERLERDAAELRERFDRAFWVERGEASFYALALDRDKKPVDALSSNAGHLLWTGIAKPERLEPMAELLRSRRLFSGFGIRTLAVGNLGYNPIGYHTGTVWPHDSSMIAHGLALSGQRDDAVRILRGLVQAAEHFSWRLPEVIAGYDRQRTGFPVEYPVACSPQAWAAGAALLSLRAAIGLEPDRAARTLTVSQPRAVDGVSPSLRWTGVRAFGKRFEISVTPDGSSVAELPGE